jgi:hypothetical protein
MDERESTAFVIKPSRKVSYWRMRRYDTYHSWGWSVDTTAEHRLSGGTAVPEEEALMQGEVLVTTVVNKLKTDILLTAGEFISADTDVVLTTSGDDMKATEALAITAPFLHSYNYSYEITSLITSPAPEELARASDEYPSYIRDRYLQLPPDFSRRVIRLGRNVTREAETPYETVVAIKKYLSGLAYVGFGAGTPPEADGVEYFLFEQESGNCMDFASAMVVMLRSSGVPARLASGYLGRSWNQDEMTLDLRPKDYHAWAEVYFPGHGWVDFEATPEGSAGNFAIDGAIEWGDGSILDSSTTGSVGDTGEPDTNGTEIAGTDADSAGAQNSEESIPDGTNVDYELYMETQGEGLLSDNIRDNSSNGWWLGSGSLVAIATMLVLLWPHIRRWRYKETDPALTMYWRVTFLASLAGIRPRGGETALEYMCRLAMAYPVQVESIVNIFHIYLESRFGIDKRLTTDKKDRLLSCWRSLSGLMIKKAVRRILLLDSLGKLFARTSVTDTAAAR